MKPSSRIEGQMAKVSGFIQREPCDGEPSSQLTEVYLGYDDKNIYAVFVAFDDEPDKVRARMTPREGISRDDDMVWVNIDTFNDERRGYGFACNPHGIQSDVLFLEGLSIDYSFDTLWYSRGQRTDRGFVVWFALPFKSLRFSDAPQQTWGVLLERWVARSNDWSFWPQASPRQSFLSQTAQVRMENISPGRNIQLIPYGLARSFRTLDPGLPDGPDFVRDDADLNAGIDAKAVIKDSLVLDATFNPDFSQVESDEPQVTVNQRFEIFFPEKRPFFIENAQYFTTPINLVFTRRIADPQVGIRLTGKAGPYAVGAFVTDDESPGRAVLPGGPLEGKRAFFGILRLARDVFRQGSIGMIYTDREFEGSFNRVGGADFRFKLSPNWALNGQAVASVTKFLDGSQVDGPAYNLKLERSGRHFVTRLEYNDIADGFRSDPGFVTRRDIRKGTYWVQYLFRPEGARLLSWGPRILLERVWDQAGTSLDEILESGITWNFTGQTSLSLGVRQIDETLRPKDFPTLLKNRLFPQKTQSVDFKSSAIPAMSVSASYGRGTTINFSPPPGQEPVKADLTEGALTLTLRPLNPLLIDNTYLLIRLTEPSEGSNIFNNHIIRSRWNWQFNRELSLRVIAQYNALLSNETQTSLPTVKNMGLRGFVWVSSDEKTV